MKQQERKDIFMWDFLKCLHRVVVHGKKYYSDGFQKISSQFINHHSYTKILAVSYALNGTHKSIIILLFYF